MKIYRQYPISFGSRKSAARLLDEFPIFASHESLGSSTRDFTPWHWHPCCPNFFNMELR